jgi:MFS family permease
MSEHKSFGLVLLGQLVLLAALGWYFQAALNPDGVAYLRLAKYYAEGNFELAVSGYWGPLLSWLLALGLKCDWPPLVAARVVMAVSALVFTWGACRIYRAVPLTRGWRVGGLLVAAFASSWWSVQFITPDLLLSGVWLLALSQLLSPNWAKCWRRAIVCGALWGVAYLVKAISLPLAVLMLLGYGIRVFQGSPQDRRVILRSLACSALALGIVALPWIAVLSFKYERLTFSTTPPITHTLTGPPDVDRYHPFARNFHVPESGRVTSWEEPSLMEYQRWSPLANGPYFRHQIRVVLRNLVTLGVLWTSLNLAALSLFWVWWRAKRDSTLRQQLGALLVLPVGLALIYLPCFFTFTEQRFFYVTLPLFFAALACWVESGLTAVKSPRLWRAWLAWGCVVGPLLGQMILIGDRTLFAGECAQQLADKMRTAQLVGPMAGSANLSGGRTGLYVAFHLQQPWHGDKLAPTPAEIAHSDAKYFLVRRDSPLAAQLRADSRFRDLDEPLFAVPATAVAFPVQVFEIRPTEN